MSGTCQSTLTLELKIIEHTFICFYLFFCLFERLLTAHLSPAGFVYPSYVFYFMHFVAQIMFIFIKHAFEPFCVGVLGKQFSNCISFYLKSYKWGSCLGRNYIQPLKYYFPMHCFAVMRTS